MKTARHREFKSLLYDQIARVTRALANPHRLELIDLLAQGERGVDELAREAGLSIANASQHLKTLLAAQLVTVRREGSHTRYRLGDPGVFRLWQSVRDLGERRFAEIDRLVHTYLGDREHLEMVNASELRDRLERGDVMVIDVRPREEYEAGHIAGARSVPLPELAARLDELPRDREVVAYCRGPFCVFADEAVALLVARGFRARRFEPGFPDWQAAGHPVC